FLSPDQYQQSLQNLSGQFEGIGAEIGTNDSTGKSSDCTTLGPDCILTVVSPIDGSPAQKAGILAGDEIVAVNGTNLDGTNVAAPWDQIRGKKGTQVVLTIVRGKAAPQDITVTRDIVVQKEVVAKSLDNGKVGYIQVTGFSDNAAQGLHDALQADLKAG